MTTNENADRVGASLERDQEHDAELARIVAVWSELPAVLLKGTMLAIVDSAGVAVMDRVAGVNVRNSG